MIMFPITPKHPTPTIFLQTLNNNKSPHQDKDDVLGRYAKYAKLIKGYILTVRLCLINKCDFLKAVCCLMLDMAG